MTYQTERAYNGFAHASVEPRCRMAVKTFFNRFEFVDGTQYGVDLISDRIKWTMELEHRDIFKDSFPYSTYHYLARKRHFVIEPSEFDYCFCVVSADFRRGLIINKAKLAPHLQGEPKLIRANGKLESVYDVPLSAFTPLSFD